MKTTTKLWIWILTLALLSPLGVILPEYFKAGSAWGEWGIEDLRKMVGYIPGGLNKLCNIWKAPLPDYAFRGGQVKGLGGIIPAYLVSAVVGILAVVIAAYLLGKFLIRNEK